MEWQPMPEALAGYLVREAHAAAPDEMCGFVVVNWGIIPVQNVHPEPQSNYAMDEPALLDVMLHAEDVWGVYHSHPKGNTAPSGHDVRTMVNYQPHGFRFWIATYNNVYEWRLQDGEPRSVRRDGTTGLADMAYPILTAAAPL